MNKQEFLAAIRERINGLSQADINKSIDYYSEMIDDRIEEGMTEAEAVAAMGSVEDIAAQILGTTPVGAATVTAAEPSKRRLSGGAIALIILGAPLWIPLLIALLAVVLAVVITVWAIVISLFAVVVAVAAVGVAGLVGGFVAAFALGIYPGMAILGTGLVLAGLTVLFFMGSVYVAKGVVWLCKAIFSGVSYVLKGGKA